MNIEEEIEKIKSEEDSIIRARMIFDLHKNKYVKIKIIADGLSMSQIGVCNLLRINKLPEIVIDGYYSQSVSLTHLFIIARLKNTDDMITLYEQVLTQNLTTTQTDAKVREKLYNLDSEGEHFSKQQRDELLESFKRIDENIDVSLVQSRIRAKIILTINGNLHKTGKILKKIEKTVNTSKISE